MTDHSQPWNTTRCTYNRTCSTKFRNFTAQHALNKLIHYSVIANNTQNINLDQKGSQRQPILSGKTSISSNNLKSSHATLCTKQ